MVRRYPTDLPRTDVVPSALLKAQSSLFTAKIHEPSRLDTAAHFNGEVSENTQCSVWSLSPHRHNENLLIRGMPTTEQFRFSNAPPPPDLET